MKRSVAGRAPAGFASVQLILLLMLLMLSACAQKQIGKPDELTEREQLNLQLSIRYLQQGDLSSAADKLRKVLETRPGLVVANGLLGLIYNEQGDHARAESHFKRALKSADKNRREYAEVNNNYGVFLCRQGKYQEAQKAFQIAYEHRDYLTPESAYENAALCALDQKDHQQAEMFFRKVLEAKPQMPRSLLGMARLQLEQGKPFIGRAYIERYESIQPQSSDEALWLGYEIEMQLNAQKQAQRYRTSLLSKYPNSKYAVKVK